MPFRKIKGHELASCFSWRGLISRLFEGGCFATTISQSHDAAASQIIARITLRKVRSGDYRVNFRDGSEMTAYCADNLEDDVKTAVEMVRTRDVMQAVDEAVATEPLQDRIADMPLNPKATPPEVEE